MSVSLSMAINLDGRYHYETNPTAKNCGTSRPIGDVTSCGLVIGWDCDRVWFMVHPLVVPEVTAPVVTAFPIEDADV